MSVELTPWIESLGVLALALSGIPLGWWLSRIPRWGMAIGFALPLLLIVCIGLGRHLPQLEFVAPISWLLSGRTEFALSGWIAALILSTLVWRLRTARERSAVLGFLLIFILLECVWPFLAPAFNRSLLRSLKTQFDRDGVCLQSTDYNCGPAAAVTALRHLGFPAEEGDIAILAHTSNAIGTPGDLLALALQERFGGQGLRCQNRYFEKLSDLRAAGLTLAVIRFGLLVDHYVVVERVDEGQVVVADPFRGRRTLTRQEFETAWRHTGISLGR